MNFPHTAIWLASLALNLVALPLIDLPPIDLPPANVDVDYQLGGAARPAANVGIVVRDRTANPSVGNYNICYVNAFQTQPNQKRLWKRHPRLVLRSGGQPVVDEVWGEKLLDIRTKANRRALGRIVGRWIVGCASHGFDAVEFDNLDSFSRSNGLLKPPQAKKYAARLVRKAHQSGLAAGQKNWANWNGRSVGFDFAVAEECGRWGECHRYVNHFGARVIVIEYRRRDFEGTCVDFGDQLSVVLRDLELTPTGVHQWC